MSDRLRFYPDQGAYSALWLTADDGHEIGLTSFDDELPRALREEIEAWVRRWESFTIHGPDSGTPEQHEQWRVDGRSLLAQVSALLEPAGWKVEEDFEREPERELRYSSTAD